MYEMTRADLYALVPLFPILMVFGAVEARVSRTSDRSRVLTNAADFIVLGSVGGMLASILALGGVPWVPISGVWAVALLVMVPAGASAVLTVAARIKETGGGS